jgi:hypothetical protein
LEVKSAKQIKLSSELTSRPFSRPYE